MTPLSVVMTQVSSPLTFTVEVWSCAETGAVAGSLADVLAAGADAEDDTAPQPDSTNAVSRSARSATNAAYDQESRMVPLMVPRKPGPAARSGPSRRWAPYASARARTSTRARVLLSFLETPIG